MLASRQQSVSVALPSRHSISALLRRAMRPCDVPTPKHPAANMPVGNCFNTYHKRNETPGWTRLCAQSLPAASASVSLWTEAHTQRRRVAAATDDGHHLWPTELSQPVFRWMWTSIGGPRARVKSLCRARPASRPRRWMHGGNSTRRQTSRRRRRSCTTLCRRCRSWSTTR